MRGVIPPPRPNRRERRAIFALETLRAFEAFGLIEYPNGRDAPFVIRQPQEILAKIKSDPRIYKTPAGNLVSMHGPDGLFDHWATPEEAAACGTDAAAIDADNPAGFQVPDKWPIGGRP